MAEAKAQVGGSDEVELMTDNQRAFSQVNYWLFVLSGSFPIILQVTLFLVNLNIFISSPIVIAGSLASAYVIRTFFSDPLVGLQWTYDSSANPAFPHISYNFRSAQFVPSTFDSNLFWSAHFVCLFAWVVIGIAFGIAGGFLFFVLPFANSAIEAISISLFMRCHQKAKKASDEVARSLLLDSVAQFPNVEEEDSK